MPGRKGQHKLDNRLPHLDLKTIRYPRVLDAFEKARNKSFEILSRKQRDGESFEMFHSVLSDLATQCNLGTLERRILRDIFIVNMSNKKSPTELLLQKSSRRGLSDNFVLSKRDNYAKSDALIYYSVVLWILCEIELVPFFCGGHGLPVKMHQDRGIYLQIVFDHDLVQVDVDVFSLEKCKNLQVFDFVLF